MHTSTVAASEGQESGRGWRGARESESCPLSPVEAGHILCKPHCALERLLCLLGGAWADERMQMGAFITAKPANLLVPRQEWRL